jgi:hypothetical protein
MNESKPSAAKLARTTSEAVRIIFIASAEPIGRLAVMLEKSREVGQKLSTAAY